MRLRWNTAHATPHGSLGPAETRAVGSSRTRPESEQFSRWLYNFYKNPVNRILPKVLPRVRAGGRWPRPTTGKPHRLIGTRLTPHWTERQGTKQREHQNAKSETDEHSFSEHTQLPPLIFCQQTGIHRKATTKWGGQRQQGASRHRQRQWSGTGGQNKQETVKAKEKPHGSHG